MNCPNTPSAALETADCRDAVRAVRAVRKAEEDSNKVHKFWFRFEESDQNIDQEFFVRLPDRRATTLVRTESGGFRMSEIFDAASHDLLVQGTCYATAREVAELIARWVRERRALIVVETASGAGLTYRPNAAPELEYPDFIAADIAALAEGCDKPLRLRAMELPPPARQPHQTVPELATSRSACSP